MWYVGGELYHHGIKGQHWGERRYQNPDGSYTEEGRKRYGIGDNGKVSLGGARNYFRDKYGSDGSAKGDREARKKLNAERKEYEKDYRQQMANRAKTKESKQDIHNRLREKYGDVEYQTFEALRKQRSVGKKLIAAGVAALSVAGIAAIASEKVKKDRQKENEAAAGLLGLFKDSETIYSATDKYAMQPTRDELNKALNNVHAYNKNYKNTQTYKNNNHGAGVVKGVNKMMDDMYSRAFANTRRSQSFRSSDASRWKNASTGERMYINDNPHMTRNQQKEAAVNPFYNMRSVTRSTSMRSRGQAMQYAPKSNSFTRNSNGLRRKYKPTW